MRGAGPLPKIRSAAGRSIARRPPAPCSPAAERTVCGEITFLFLWRRGAQNGFCPVIIAFAHIKVVDCVETGIVPGAESRPPAERCALPVEIQPLPVVHGVIIINAALSKQAAKTVKLLRRNAEPDFSPLPEPHGNHPILFASVKANPPARDRGQAKRFRGNADASKASASAWGPWLRASGARSRAGHLEGGRKSREARGFFKSEREVHVLDRLPRRALDHVVDGRDRDERPRAFVDVQRDVAEI